MFKSVTNWLENVGLTVKNDDEGEEVKPEAITADSEVEKSKQKSEKSSEQQENVQAEQSNKHKEEEKFDSDAVDGGEEPDAIDKALDEAYNTAKEWGSYLFNVGKSAGKTVVSSATKLTSTVQEKTMLGDFQKEQSAFVTTKQDKENRAEAAVPPWVGYNEEEQMKSQILALSQDKRNFMRNPPSGVQFYFDFDTMFPIAVATLQEDPNLEKMRFELVPQKISEESFWRNYFYRVSLIKQSTQLTSLAQQTGTTGETKSSGSSRRSSTDSSTRVPLADEAGGSSPHVHTPTAESHDDELAEPDSPADHEFVSDSFDDHQLNEQDLNEEMQQLGVKEEKTTSRKDDSPTDSLPDWEKELQAELAEYEMVNEDADEDDDLENEILQQIEDEANGV